MNKTITVIKGDGIGPEIVTEALKVLDKIAAKYGHTFTYQEILAGGCAIDAYGRSLTEEALEKCLDCDSVLLGAVGGPKWDGVAKEIRPEAALLGIRSAMGLYANLRPARLFPQLADASPLKPEIVARGIDLMMVRELISGAYFGEHKTVEENGELRAHDDMTYSEHEIRRIAHTAFQTARKRDSRVISVDKANVLDSSRLWRKVVHEVAAEYPDVACTDMLVDNTAMQLVKNPSQFDVVVTENLFGDILSDESSMITGSIGMMASASLGDGTRGMYEPIHGSAPDIAGQNLANPIGTILSAAMMLRYSFDMTVEADVIEAAVNTVLDEGYRTGDIMSEGMKKVSCSEMGSLIADKI
ncbi:MAG: 3-isopropylmalate dehydrogenase [Oscillospiraceae bacterium]|nr:3-isopropylmalate dehydrogenase [Oscillospiraceae bacterium]